MKKLKILVSLVGILTVFSFANVSAMEKNINQGKQNNVNNENVFTIDQFEEIYETIKQNKSFNEKFFKEIDAVAKAIWSPCLPGLKVKKIYDQAGQLIPIYPSTIVTEQYFFDYVTHRIVVKISEDKFFEDTARNYFSFKEPLRFKERFKDKVDNLSFIKIFKLIFKNYKFNFEKYIDDFEDDECNVANADNLDTKYLIFNEHYFENILNELSKLPDEYKNYEFKINDSGVTCLSEDEEGKDLEELINYCICVLKFVELIIKRPNLVDLWYEYRQNTYKELKLKSEV